MRISVIILNWERPEDTLKAVRSVLRQDYPDLDILIWDNASSDRSREILTKELSGFSKIQLVFAEFNYGVAGGRNRAVRTSTGDILFFLDSDAVIEGSDALSLVARRMNEDRTIGALSFEVKRPDGYLMWPFSRSSAEWRHREFETMRVDGCAFAVRRVAFERAGGFAEHFSPYGAEDQHFAYKVIDCNYRILYFPSAVAIHAFSPSGRTGLQFTMHVRNMLMIPLELFPMPHAIASFSKSAASLASDAIDQRQKRDFLRGLWRSLTGFTFNERIPLSHPQWRHLREIVKEEKSLTLK